MWSTAVCLTCLLCSADAANEPTSPELSAAKEKYVAAVEAARKTFIEQLEAAGKTASKKGDRDEGMRISEMLVRVRAVEAVPAFDQLERTRRRLEGTTWTWNRPEINDKNTMQFKADGVWQTTVPQKGIWVVATERKIVASFRNERSKRDELFLFEFDDDLKNFDVKAFGDIPTKFAGGTKSAK